MERRSMGTPFTGFGNRMAGCFSFRKRWRAVNKAGQKTYTQSEVVLFIASSFETRNDGLNEENGRLKTLLALALLTPVPGSPSNRPSNTAGRT